MLISFNSASNAIRQIGGQLPFLNPDIPFVRGGWRGSKIKSSFILNGLSRFLARNKITRFSAMP